MKKLRTHLAYSIAEGISTLKLWKNIGTEVETPQVYTFTHNDKDYTLEPVNGEAYWLLNGSSIVVVQKVEKPGTINEIKVFESKKKLDDWSEFTASKSWKKVTFLDH